MKRQILLATVALALSSPLALAQSNSNGTMATGAANATAGTAGTAGNGVSTNNSAVANMKGPAGSDMSQINTPGEFVPVAAQSNMLEIQMAKLALKKSQDDQVRKFAQRMIDDHSKAGKNLKQAVQKSDATVNVPSKLDAAHQAKLDKLQGMSGQSFNSTYIDMNLKAHQQAVNLFQTYAKNGQKGPVKTFASKTLPTLKDHLQMITKIAKSS